jgi:hypothetical protein
MVELQTGADAYSVLADARQWSPRCLFLSFLNLGTAGRLSTATREYTEELARVI